LTRAQTNIPLHGRDRHLAIAQISGAKNTDDRLSDAIGVIVIDHHLDFDLGGILNVSRTTIFFRPALLRACSFDFEDSHARDFRASQNFLDFIKLERLDDRFNFLHRSILSLFI
jgi:hypothetical protein